MPNTLLYPQKKVNTNEDHSQAPSKQQRGGSHRDHGEDEKVRQIGGNRGKSGVLQKQTLEGVDGIGEGVDPGNRLHPAGESLLRIYGATRKKEQRIQHPEYS